ncbi:MAG TPA: hemerythrin domain-containing protein [Mycobacterium sp.]|nr:hemerythrin domain-containing protein [Mycobacterium sp.]
MPAETPGEALSAALEREHQEVDAGIAAFLASVDAGTADADGLHTTLEALRRHIYLEERILFPPIRHGGMVMALAVMMQEHGEIWHTMDALADLVAAGGDSDRIRETGRQLLTQLEAHNDKEEPVIYPAADTGLQPEKSAELADFISTGLMPDSWVCREA